MTRPRTGVDLASQPRTGVDLASQPRADADLASQPRTGVDLASQPRADVDLASQPRADVDLASQPRADVDLASQPRTGVDLASQPRIGVDLVPFTRVRELLDPGIGPVLKRYLTAEELTVSRTPDGAPDPAGIAGRLAAKEAVFKLLGAVGRPVPWKGIEVLRGPGGRPGVRLSGRAAELARSAGLGPIDVSISHDAGFAIAVAAASISLDPQLSRSAPLAGSVTPKGKP